MNWRIALLGTFHPAVPTLERLAQRGWITLVVMPRDAGEKNQGLLDICLHYGLPYTYELGDLARHDVNLVLAANYPKIVPSHILEAYPCINTHWSALPKYRGVHGTAWSLLNQDYHVGCTVHWMEEAFDEGDVLAQEIVEMAPDMDINALHEVLAQRQAEAVLRLLEMGNDPRSWPSWSQDASEATYVPQRTPEDGVIDWSWPTERIWNLVRALPRPKYPGAYTFLGDRKLVVWQARPVECPPYFCTCGQVVRVRKGIGVWVKTGDTCLEIQEVEFGGAPERVQAADCVLKRGTKLGYNPQSDIASLRQQVATLEEQLQALRRAHG